MGADLETRTWSTQPSLLDKVAILWRQVRDLTLESDEIVKPNSD